MGELQALNREMSDFFRPLWPGEDKPLVFGEGNTDNPQLMLIGEAPGEQEVIQKRPFVGKAGKNLDEFLQLACLKREQIYVSNTVKIRPTEKGKGASRVRNRAPNKEELALFVPFLLREIKLVSPRLLVTLGNIPLQALFGKEATVGQWHGKTHTLISGMPVFVLYHPASLIYRPQLKETYINDVITLRDMVPNLRDNDN